MKIEAELYPINKKWWQFWRRKRKLTEGKHFIVDKGTGLINFKITNPKGYECKVTYNVAKFKEEE